MDRSGRALHAVGRATTVLDWHWYPNFFLFWGQVQYEFDGRLAFGEPQDYCPSERFRRLNRSGRGVEVF